MRDEARLFTAGAGTASGLGLPGRLQGLPVRRRYAGPLVIKEEFSWRLRKRNP